MNVDTLTRGIMIAQCLEILEQAEATLGMLLAPKEHKANNVCTECQEEDVYKWLNSN